MLTSSHNGNQYNQNHHQQTACIQQTVCTADIRAFGRAIRVADGWFFDGFAEVIVCPAELDVQRPRRRGFAPRAVGAFVIGVVAADDAEGVLPSKPIK